MTFEPVTQDQLDLCTDIIYESGLGKKYYPKKEWLRDKMEQAYPHDQIYLAKENGMSVGVLWYQVEGMFCRYPYLHMIAVERSFRYRRYGKQLMHFYESNLAHFHQAVSLRDKIVSVSG